ncbi:MAG: hypothetical protein ONB27_04590 [candidate division KSB1 bacterium]|nr:hypothetical protein [candidate division KSB1 bacterium]
MAYVLISKVVLIFPHWDISWIALINYDLYYLIFLVSMIIFLKDAYNRYIYLNIAFFSFIYVLGFLTIFLGKTYSIGDDFFQYYVWTYRKILISLITCVTLCYIPVQYLFFERATTQKYLIAVGVTMPIGYLYFRNFIINPHYVFEAKENFQKIFDGILGMNFLALFFLLLYGFLFLYLNRPMSGHVNLIAVAFLLFLGVDSVDNLFNKLHKPVPILSQLFLIVNLMLFAVILISNLKYIQSEFGKFYEKLRYQQLELNVKIIRKMPYYERWWIELRRHFQNRPYRFFCMALLIITLGLFIHFYPFSYSKMSFLVLIVLIGAMIWYLHLLIKRRSKIENAKHSLKKQLIHSLSEEGENYGSKTNETSA